MSTTLLPRRTKVLEQQTFFSADSAPGTFVPLTDWIPAVSCPSVKALLEITDLQGSGSSFCAVRAGYQLATHDPASPHPPYQISTTSQTSVGKMCTGIKVLSGATAAERWDRNMYARFGACVFG